MGSYAVKEMFLTLQGEGVQVGRRAVFLRFAGCNLWSGREEDRAEAQCRFCDTDFVGLDGDNGGRYRDADALADAALAMWGDVPGPFIVMTGGEPLLQVDDALVAALKARGFEIAVETNGTQQAPAGIDWICVSPKAGTDVVLRRGDELKLVWPQPGIDPLALEDWDFGHFLLQPMDGPELADARAAVIAFVMDHPKWRLSTQTHKVVGIR
ncbi:MULTISPECIES: 7-carboxy-7-deazaguanine synthase [unclassified Sphingomonas]|uniref:7-carboxy-7-deazaguanine synthase n=1 Tax=unclassified Sphingomonas TaxID=196159 RepID=UPI0006F92BAD|nr:MULTISPECIES: 7-carboxy-7-deazaguanine synthase [unclassified Sphingomonas]KQX26252.1 7-carboxy-7-deazaguanine synthase [Sphingomonas sp. Root1294]KQY69321.1 7-carboxy-7-deazaguanine synthase [Sphingomonas sp. Root50]KRB89580.1 7-carboxy-7-deazaguanine synthase [Sphingomonas sp. Root720]